MFNPRLLALAGGGALVVGAMSLLAARAIERVDDPPTLEEWAAISCAAMSDPLTGEPWETLRNRFAAALAGLDSAAPAGNERFQAALVAGTRFLTIELDAMTRRDPGGNLNTLLADLDRVPQIAPRGPTGDTVLADLYAARNRRDSLAREAAASLPQQSRAAIEDVPGCAEQLFASRLSTDPQSAAS